MSNQTSSAPRELPPPLTEGGWLVQTGHGVAAMTLDELDDAFQRGEVSADTRVYTSGMRTWETLRVLARLDELDGESACAEAAPPAHATHASIPPAKPPELGSFRPLTLVAQNIGGIYGGPTTAPSQQPTTGVQRSPARLPFALRRAVAVLQERLSAFDLRRSRLAQFALGTLGGVVGVLVFASLYELVAGERPLTEERNGALGVQPRVASPAATPSVTALPSASSTSSSSSSSSFISAVAAVPAPSPPRPGATPAQYRTAASPTLAAEESLATVRASQLRAAPPRRKATQRSRGTRAKASLQAARRAKQAAKRRSRAALE